MSAPGLSLTPITFDESRHYAALCDLLALAPASLRGLNLHDQPAGVNQDLPFDDGLEDFGDGSLMYGDDDDSGEAFDE